MSGPRPLREIADAMEQLAGPTVDPEAAHGRADDLLLEAIDRLAPYATETTDEMESERLTAAFARVHKWYA